MMIDARYLNDITAGDIKLYLQGSHWTEQTVNEVLSIWSREGLEQELYVPRKQGAIDFRSQLSLLLRFLAEIEERDPLQIASDMRFTGADVIRLHIDTSVLDRGTIAFSSAAEIIAQAEKMLLAAARAAIHPQNFFPASRPSAEVSDYIGTTRLGQTEPGSFIFIIVSPVTYRPAAQALRHPDEEAAAEIPFARQVTGTLSRSLEAIRGAAAFQGRELTSVFEEIVDDGVSANLCEALSAIAETSHDRAVELDFTWSSKAPRPQPRTQVVVPAMITPVLSDMAKHLKAVSPEPGFEVLGRVERLSNQELGEGFDLALRGAVAGKERLIALQLGDDEREIASTAWRTGRTVFTRGTLDKRFRPYRLIEPEIFQLV